MRYYVCIRDVQLSGDGQLYALQRGDSLKYAGDNPAPDHLVECATEEAMNAKQKEVLKP